MIKRILYSAIALVIALPLFLTSAFATDRVILKDRLTISDSRNVSSYSDGVYTATGKGGNFSATENTITITNNSLNKANVTFDYTATGYGSFTVDGVSGGASGSVDWTLTAGASKTIKIRGTSGLLTGGTNGVLTIRNIVYTELIEGPATITYNTLGSVTVDGAAFASGSTTGTLGEAGANLVATPNSGAAFVAWIKTGTNEVISLKESFDLKPYASAMSIQAVFTTSTSPAYYMTNSVLYNDLNTALSAANSGDKKVVVVGSGTLPAGTIDIPAGITFLVPYSSSDHGVDGTTNTVEGGMNSTLEHANKKLVISNRDDMLMPHNKVTYTLTIPSDTTVNVAYGGKFVIGGTICCGHDDYIGIICGTAGDHSNVQLEGTLNVSGILSSCGYILGGGQINVANGGAAYQPFVVMDQRNGQYVVGTTTRNDNIFPWNRYALMNIRCNVTLAHGASMKGYMDAYTAFVDLPIVGPIAERHTVACQTIIGPSGALFNVAGGSLDISYDPNKHVNDVDYTTGNAQYGKGLHNRVGTTTIEFNGDVSIGSLTLTLNVAGSNYSVNSNTDYFPIPYNFQIHQNSGTFTVSQKLKLLPGALLHIHENAALNVTKQLAAMDGFSDQCDVSQATMSADKYARYRYPVAADLMAAGFCGTAQLIVDGTMTVSEGAAFGGVVQTGGSGTVTMSGTPGLTVIAGPRSQESVALTTANISGRTVYELTPRLFIPGENKTLEMQKGKTYVALDGEKHTIASFDYTLHTTANNNSATEEVPNRELKAGVIGTWQCAEGLHTFSNGKCSDCGADIVAAIWSDSTATYYHTLGAALKAPYNSSTDYIQMLKDTNESVTITGTINLDLGGHTIAGVTLSGTLNGMDTANNDFSSTPGSITKLSIDGGSVSEVYQYNLGNLIGKQYIACPNGDSISFHRFDMGVKKYTFYKQGDTGALVFDLVFRGDNAAFNEIFQTGACITGDGHTQYTWTEKAREYSGNIQLTKDDFSKAITVKAAVKLNEGDADSNASLGDKYFAEGISLQALLDAMNNGGAG